MQHLLHTTKRGTKIGVDKGKKPQSAKDFIVRYQEPGKRERTPKHIHIIIDLYIKREHEPALTAQLVDCVIEVIKHIKPARTFPPKFQFFPHYKGLPCCRGALKRFRRLNTFGEYSVEFLLAVAELVMIQEKTNYPCGTMNLRLFQKFRERADIFSVVSAATFR